MRLVKKFLSLILSGSLLISGCGFVKAKKINNDEVASSQTTQVEKESKKVVSDEVTDSQTTEVSPSSANDHKGSHATTDTFAPFRLPALVLYFIMLSTENEIVQSLHNHGADFGNILAFDRFCNMMMNMCLTLGWCTYVPW